MNNPYIKLVKNKDASDIFDLVHPRFTAQISKFGGHLLAFKPTNQEQWLWLSTSAKLDGSKPIRGGVPLCWPWFGPATGEFEGEPQHGYIRSLDWELILVEGDDKALTVRLSPIMPSELKERLGLDVFVEYKFSNKLKISLVTTNVSETPRPLSQAIHTYFRVDDIHNTEIIGLDNCQFVDKLTKESKQQVSDIKIDQSVDRVYVTDQPDLSCKTNTTTRLISGAGHDSIVVWNPWKELAKDIPDFDDNGYLNMVCIEMANTQGFILAPGKTHKLKQNIR
ncbi:D-hexose-6-phosphate mutarotase [Psychrosphaera sp. B3R10]|uniref:D-hexose-6-phosphate mutarotase n=1 Tax=unclassified Psychrosphaera TaxID=2641570 RepID=UPI001C084F51|nr:MULTISPECIES: D-hexose-6-phosphate mutarotase [unclassified Psychrosphaera]MBU2882183.1 D-hexose-6-phosphate mutarotase [Psychrosphaera sp. I2R16]MBU2988864.1 D-hexose-6-phosphate mutarotase [Psychrosphaera sp. B3R10]